jgi:glycosyltransferase involved in cell wall biosynthesis
VKAPLDSARALIRRVRFRATPVDALPALIGTKLAQAKVGSRIVDAVRRRSEATPARKADHAPVSRQRRSGGRNVLFVSHCDFIGASAYHVLAIATELERLGWSPAIAVPRNPRGVRDVGRPSFPVLSFRSAARGRLRFPDGHGPDLVHAFTPREHVRNLTLDVAVRYGCPYIVHLEDNENAVQDVVITGYDPADVRVFLDRAAGMSVVIERLLELKPDHVRAAVIWPGYDEAIMKPGRPREAIRRDIGLAEGAVAVLYTGNIHKANADEVRSLYQAIESVRAAGRNLVLVKSGWNRTPDARLPRLGEGLHDLGWVSRGRVFELLRGADIVVQPGSPGPFNDYRFPSKLPEFLASGRPVVLPRTNIGLHLEDGVDAMLLDEGGRDEIADKVSLLADDPDLRMRLGDRGRAFALHKLQWSTNVREVAQLYEEASAT